jgi:hypothetical protein
MNSPPLQVNSVVMKMTSKVRRKRPLPDLSHYEIKDEAILEQLKKLEKKRAI